MRSWISTSSSELFNHPNVKNFVNDKALAEGAEVRRVLNDAHHEAKKSLTYMDVKNIDDDLVRLKKSIEKVHQHFRRYRWREPLAAIGERTASIVQLPVVKQTTFSVPICTDIAAFIGSTPAGGSQDVTNELLDGNYFDGKALFYIRGDSLGFSIPSGSVAIVEAEPYEGRDLNLVIAKHKKLTFARRLVKAPGSLSISLEAQNPDPRSAHPTMSYDENTVRLYRIVGAIFTNIPPPLKGRGEAVQVDTAPELAQIKIAYRVREESAIPLALPKQVIFGGSELSPCDLSTCEGKFVAVTLDDGTSIFKRVGAQLTGELSHLRLFETIGGLGSSMVIATEETERRDGMPIMVSARRILGVLFS